MRIQLAFQYTCPPPSETVYGLEGPCPRAQGTVPGGEECLYRQICENSSAALRVVQGT